MSLSDSLNSILTEDIPTAFSRFGRLLDAEWIHEALEETGTASVRRRKIPAELVVWLVIGMAMYRDQAISVVVKHLGLTLPSQRNKNGPAGGTSVVPGAIPAARYRVGAAPMEHIFKRTALTWAIAAAEKQPWKGLSLFGVDGTTLRVQDTDENREVFGLPPSSRGQAGYPQTRIVTLMALRSHLIAGVAFGPCRGKKTGEQTLARQLWPQLPEKSLTIVDKGFMDYGLFYRLSHADAQSVTGLKHWLTRAKKNAAWKTLEVLGEGDELVELTFCHAARKRDPELPRTMVARAINYQVAGHDPQTLLTSLLDAELYPALEVAALYHERWELEVGYDELKTDMLERKESLRSKKPEGVEQEIWGIMLAYNLVRTEILDVAAAAGVEPTRVSFRHTLQLVRVLCLVQAWTSPPGTIPKLITAHLEMMKSLILPERRSERRYERHVKIKMSSYKRNPGRPAKGSESLGNSAK